MNIDLQILIAQQIERLAHRKAAYRAYDDACEIAKAGERELLQTMIDVSGKKVGDVIRTKDDREGRIRGFRLTADSTTLVAACDAKTKSTGKWSHRVGFAVAINIGD